MAAGTHAYCPLVPYQPDRVAMVIAGVRRDQKEADIITPPANPKNLAQMLKYRRLYVMSCHDPPSWSNGVIFNPAQV